MSCGTRPVEAEVRIGDSSVEVDSMLVVVAAVEEELLG
jgi:hypothetical protein